MYFNSTLEGNEVCVEYVIDANGSFSSFYVLIYEKDGPIDIAKYLHPSQIDSLQYEAQMHYLEVAVNTNEEEINAS